MRTHGILVAALVLATSFVLADSTMAQSGSAPSPARALASPIGKIMTATGAVTVERASAAVVQASGAGSAAAVTEGDLVYRGDVVATGADGKVSLVFADGTAFNVGSNARMELNEFVYNPDGKSNSSFFSLLKGTFTFVAGKIAKTGSMKLDTPVATMGIRGTTPHVVVSEDGTVSFSTLVEEKR
jgi:hypothetical protein